MRHHISLIYGGGKMGLMGVLANHVLELKGEVIGVIPKILVEREMAHPHLTQLHVVSSMQERKSLMAELAQGFLLLPGGVGSLDEFFEMTTLLHLGLHDKPCGILNMNHYFDSLLDFLEHAVAEGFIDRKIKDALIIENNADRLMNRFLDYKKSRMIREYESAYNILNSISIF